MGTITYDSEISLVNWYYQSFSLQICDCQYYNRPQSSSTNEENGFLNFPTDASRNYFQIWCGGPHSIPTHLRIYFVPTILILENSLQWIVMAITETDNNYKVVTTDVAAKAYIPRILMCQLAYGNNCAARHASSAYSKLCQWDCNCTELTHPWCDAKIEYVACTFFWQINFSSDCIAIRACHMHISQCCFPVPLEYRYVGRCIHYILMNIYN